MSLEEGTNYIFVLANPDSVVRLKSKVDPFYDFKPEEIEELPFLFASPALLPRFLYFLEWNRISFSHKPIDFMAYLSFEKGKIFSKGKRFPRTVLRNRKRHKISDPTKSVSSDRIRPFPNY